MYIPLGMQLPNAVTGLGILVLSTGTARGRRAPLAPRLPHATPENSQAFVSATAPHAMGNPGLLYDLTSNHLNYSKHPNEPFGDARAWEILVQHLLTLISTQLICSAATKIIRSAQIQTGRAEP